MSRIFYIYLTLNKGKNVSNERTVDKNHMFQAMVHLIEKSKNRYPQFDFKISEDGNGIVVNNCNNDIPNSNEAKPLSKVI
jgi:hypothetical protein